MQLGKIILQNQVIHPPTFDDIVLWINFRKYTKEKLKIKSIVKSLAFSIVTGVLIIIAFVNSFILLYGYTLTSQVINNILAWLFLLELALKIIAIGPEMLLSSK